MACPEENRATVMTIQYKIGHVTTCNNIVKVEEAEWRLSGFTLIKHPSHFCRFCSQQLHILHEGVDVPHRG